MTGEHNRDRAIEQLLRDTRREGEAAQPCMDAESLASWSDGTLSPAEARRVEAHLSECDRCQSMLAAFARAEPTATAPSEPFWHRWRLQWLAPAAAAATALALWVAVPRDRPPVPAAVEERPSLAPARPAAQLREVAPASPREGRQAGETANRSRTASGGLDAGATPDNAPGREEDRRAAARNSEAAVPPVALAPNQLGSAAAAKDSARRATGDKSASAGAGAPGSGGLPAAVAAPSTPAPVTSPSAAEAVAGASPPPPPRVNFARSDAASPRVPLDVASPDGVHRWRIDVTGQLQHSSSGGATWQTVSLATADVLTTGSSPGGSVCWLVGRNGTVWVTSDGLRFDRRSLPEPGDVMSVVATDARHATIVIANGRTLVTADGGVTWTPPAP